MSGFLNKDNLPHLIQKLTDGDNIKITGNKHGDRVGKVINKLIDKSNETLGASFKELKNEGYSFKAGEGSGINLSNSTLDSFTTFALEGNTYKNLVKNGAKELILNPEINKEGTGFEIEDTSDNGKLNWTLDGQTLKNILVSKECWFSASQVNDGKFKIIKKAPRELELQITEELSSWKYIGAGFVPEKSLQVGKEYTVIFEKVEGIQSVSIRKTDSTHLSTDTLPLYGNRVKLTIKDTIGKDEALFLDVDNSPKRVYIKNPMILEGDYTQKEVPTFIEGVQGVGRKTKNLFNEKGESEKEYLYQYNTGSKSSNPNYTSYKLIIKPNVAYTIQGFQEIKDVYQNTHISFYDSSSLYISGLVYNVSTGEKSKTFTTPKNAKYIIISNGKNTTKTQLEEGDAATSYEPSFEGYKIGVKTHGKNLFDIKDILELKYIRPFKNGFEISNNNYANIRTLEIMKNKFKENTQYSITYSKGTITGNFGIIGEYTDGESIDARKGNLTTKPHKTIKRLSFSYGDSSISGVSQIYDIQIEEGKQATSYEPYKESTSEIILQDQLQGIGDVKDKLYFDNGYKIEKNIKVLKMSEVLEIVSPQIRAEATNDEFLTLQLSRLEDAREGTDVGLLETYPLKPTANSLMEGGRFHLGILYFTIKKDKLSGKKDISAFEEYVGKNDFNVYYQLATPTTTDTTIKTEMLPRTFNTKTYITQDSGVKGNLKISNKGYETYNLLPNKEYTVIADRQVNSTVTIDLCGIKKVIQGDQGTISTSSNINGELKFYGSRGISNIRLLEGNHINKSIGYFEGVQGVGETGEIKAKTCGKNLIDFSNMQSRYSSVEVKPSLGEVKILGSGYKDIQFYVYLKKGSRYNFSVNGGASLEIELLRGRREAWSYESKMLNTLSGFTLNEKSGLYTIHISKLGDSVGKVYKNFLLEEVDSNPSYEPREESDFSVELEEPLMRLPSGVCDEITKDGKLIRRIGKIVLTGEENWFNYETPLGNTSARNVYFGTNVIDKLCQYERGRSRTPLCTSFAELDIWTKDLEAFTIQGGDGISYGLRFRLNKNKLNSIDGESVKQWFREHPTTVWYELKTPTITDIKPLQARLFKNGHVIFDNKIAPVSTYEVAVNKPAQINAGIKETKKLENRVNALEGLYDSMLLENSHILSNLEFDFSLMKEVEE